MVAFRESSKAVASHSRVTGLVIDDYTNPDASDQDYWVSLYGSHNRLDHSQLRGKTNAGPTVVVVRDATQAWTTSTASTTTGSGRARRWASMAAKPSASAPATAH